MLATRFRLLCLVGLVFAVNYAETGIEEQVRESSLGRSVVEFGNDFAMASHSLESHISFAYHDVTSSVSVIGYSLSYFFLLIFLGLAVGAALWHRDEIQPFRVFSLSIAINYTLSLPFFLFMPVPERWYYSDSDAMLLSDLWSTSLIEWLRPISGLDNSFPSTHVSLTVILIAVCFLFNIRMRYSVTALGLTVILSTYVLGIHWIADIIAGVAIAILSVSLALRVSRSMDRKVSPGSHGNGSPAT